MSRRHPTVKAPRTRSFRLQPRDREIIRFVGSHGYVTMPQVQLLAFSGTDEFGRATLGSDQAVYRRLKKLCDAGLLTHERTWYADHGVYRATRSGLSLVDLDLQSARLDRRDYDHDLRVVDLALSISSDPDVETWITERRLRSHMKPGQTMGRIPDGLVISDTGERWAVELEISGKNTRRYADACLNYAKRHRSRMPDDSPYRTPSEHLDDYIESGGQIDGVVWYFFTPGKRDRAMKAAQAIISDRDYDVHGTDHLRFEFHDASSPSLPTFEKWWMQVEADRAAAEEERLEEQQRQKEEQKKAAYREASAYLTEGEREGVRLSVSLQFDPATQRSKYEATLKEAILDAATAKWRKESRKQERRDAMKGWIFGR